MSIEKNMSRIKSKYTPEEWKKEVLEFNLEFWAKQVKKYGGQVKSLSPVLEEMEKKGLFTSQDDNIVDQCWSVYCRLENAKKELAYAIGKLNKYMSQV